MLYFFFGFRIFLTLSILYKKIFVASPQQKRSIRQVSLEDEGAPRPPASKQHQLQPPKPPPAAPALASTPGMCFHCFDVLIDSLQNKKTSSNRVVVSNKRKNTPLPDFALADVSEECPLFVTWDKQKPDGQYQLRGCIGTLSPRLLATSVGDYALISALNDRRFSPISLSELSLLRVSVSLLVNYELARDVFDWSIGKHGILIKFEARGIHYNATYLPEVAKEQGWDHKTAINSLVQKSGYSGPVTHQLLSKIHLTRYQSSKCQVTFEEYALHQSFQKTNNLQQQQSWLSPNPKNTTSSSAWTPCNNL